MMTTQAPYLLDTNIYALFFQPNKETNYSYQNLLTKVKVESEISFYIPEIVLMEIHSVLGKYIRNGKQPQQSKHSCTRDVIVDDNSTQKCTNKWLQSVAVIKITNKKIIRDLRKTLSDIESGRDLTIKAQILPVGSEEITAGKMLLENYADLYTFGSHDALVAGTVLAANRNGLNLTLVTSDRGLKAVCRAENIKHYDPKD